MREHAAGQSDGARAEQRPPDPAFTAAKAPERKEQQTNAVRRERPAEPGTIVRDQRQQVRIGAADCGSGRLETLQIGEYEHASHADGGDGETGDDEPYSKPDEQQLAGQAEPPGGVIIQIETIGWPVAYRQDEAEQEQRKEARREHDVERVDVVEAEEEKETGEADHAGPRQRTARPAAAVARTVPGKGHIQDAD